MATRPESHKERVDQFLEFLRTELMKSETFHYKTVMEEGESVDTTVMVGAKRLMHRIRPNRYTTTVIYQPEPV
jgi:hypothetical protein